MGRVLLAVIAVLVLASVQVGVASADPAPTTVWLCSPGAPADPCGGGTGAPVDCFYVYPTASLQPTVNADNTITPEIAAVARAQAGPFDGVCNVYAPVYRQSTVLGLFTQDGPARDAALAVAYSDVENAWNDYLAHHNDGRGVVLVGHSQGTRMLKTLMQQRIEPDPRAKAKLVSALLIGNDVHVPGGQLVGSDLTSTPGCTDASQIGCVVAYSSFAAAPPPDSRFGRSVGDTDVLCTNPASLTTNERAPLAGLVPGITARCEQSNGVTVLRIEGGSAAALPALPNATWGLHLLDVNLAQTTLVDLVRSQSETYAATVGGG